MQNLIRQNPTR